MAYLCVFISNHIIEVRLKIKNQAVLRIFILTLLRFNSFKKTYPYFYRKNIKKYAHNNNDR